MYLVVSLLAVSRLQARLVFTDRDRDLLSSSHGSPVQGHPVTQYRYRVIQ